MSIWWVLLIALEFVVVVLTLADVFKQRYEMWTGIMWTVVVLVLPLAGSLVYWIARRPPARERPA
jgi:Phospholipase_D-nuclease N-terminal